MLLKAQDHRNREASIMADLLQQLLLCAMCLLPFPSSDAGRVECCEQACASQAIQSNVTPDQKVWVTRAVLQDDGGGKGADGGHMI